MQNFIIELELVRFGLVYFQCECMQLAATASKVEVFGGAWMVYLTHSRNNLDVTFTFANSKMFIFFVL